MSLIVTSIICSAIICYQDFKSRAVFWFMFPFLAIALGIIHYLKVEASFFYRSLPINFILVSIIILLLFLYSKLIAKKKFMNHSIGLGDVLFFIALAIGFPTMTFIVLFSYSLFFSLLTYLIFKKRMKLKTVPLAGLMSLFLIGVLALDIIYNLPSLYIL